MRESLTTLELLEGIALRKRLLENYSRNPKGWDFIVSPSPKSGFFDAKVSGPNGAWMLKIDSLFKPYPIVIGSEVDVFSRKPRGPFNYGYRKLSPELMLQMLGGDVASSREKSLAGLLSFLGSEPVVPEEGRTYAEGPLVLTGPGGVSLSENQKETDDRLASEMRRLLKMRYPAYG